MRNYNSSFFLILALGSRSHQLVSLLSAGETMKKRYLWRGRAAWFHQTYFQLYHPLYQYTVTWHISRKNLCCMKCFGFNLRCLKQLVGEFIRTYSLRISSLREFMIVDHDCEVGWSCMNLCIRKFRKWLDVFRLSNGPYQHQTDPLICGLQSKTRIWKFRNACALPLFCSLNVLLHYMYVLAAVVIGTPQVIIHNPL